MFSWEVLQQQPISSTFCLFCFFQDENLQRLKSNLVGGLESSEGPTAEGFVRGRFKDESKSSTFNKLWSPEEQKRFECFACIVFIIPSRTCSKPFSFQIVSL